ncbi:MAG: purine-nucleoside phosphorylase [Actinomycetota bacterium]|nr:purine-nucleoside phosphorylase [Actinomycetota bacterium]
MTSDPYAAARASAENLARLSGQDRHDVAVVLGSGWAPAADALGTPDAEFDVAELGGFPAPTVAGHVPLARSVLVDGVRVLIYLGRIHLYEGNSVHSVVHGVRTAAAAGCKVVVLTNASGGINPAFGSGQPVLISDHLNLTGKSPLTGPEPPAGYGPRFTDLSQLYSPRLRAVARQANPSLPEGVYAALPGPHYETPAEIRMLRSVGADMVGMSTALEAIAAHHAGAEVLGVSLVTNPAAGLSDSGLDHIEVLDVAKRTASRVGDLLRTLLPRMISDGPA